MEIWGTPILADVRDIIELLQTEIRAEGIDLLQDIKPTHDNVMVTCISHGEGQERKPSLGISTVDVKRHNKTYSAGTCNCFTCGYTADLPTFISHAFGRNDAGMFGYKWLTQRFVNLAIEERKPIELDMEREDNTKVDFELEESFVDDEETLEKYRFIHPYMYERKLTDKVIDYFDIGFDTANQALTFPVFDENGELALIQRRSVKGKQFINDEGGNKGNHIFGLYQVYKNLEWINELYITESPIDALTCWTYRVPAVALMGANVTETQIKLLKRVPVRKFVSALDGDEAGEKGSEKLKKNLADAKLLFRLQFPDGVKDVNAMTEQQFHERQSIII